MNQFSALGLHENLVEAVTQLGFQIPTPIQREAIPILLGGDTDVIGLARTGTGKTAAFGLPLIQLCDFSSSSTQALVLCPTRELCVQISKDLQNYASHSGGASVRAVYGGTGIGKQISELKQGAHIVIATPGRLLDLMQRGAVDLSTVDYVVLDEADEMLDMGFKDDIDTILASVNDNRTTWLFSATMSDGVRNIAHRYMVSPRELSVDSQSTQNTSIEHVYYVTRAREKYATLKRIVDVHPKIFSIVFTATKIEAQEIAERLIRDGYNADALHGDLNQQQRDKVMGRFRERSISILVATDVAARGIDVSDITHVIHYSIPDDLESYTHRSGRTARAGKTGVSISILHSREFGRLRQLERLTKTKFTRRQIPSGAEVCEQQLFNIIHNVTNVEVDNHAIDPYLPQIMDELADINKEELIKRFASIEFNRFLQYYKDAPDLNFDHGEDNDRERISNDNFTDMKIFVGTKDGFDKGKLFRYLLDTTGLKKTSIGRITTRDIISFFGVENQYVERVVKAFAGKTVGGRSLKVQISGGAPSGNKPARDGGDWKKKAYASDFGDRSKQRRRK